MTPIEAAFESCRDRLPAGTTLEQFAAGVRNYDCTPVMVRGAVAGAVLTHGAEIHACVLPFAHKRWISKGLIAGTLDRVLRENGHAVTHVAEGNETGHAFVRRWGFEEVKRENGIVEYRLEAQRGH